MKKIAWIKKLATFAGRSELSRFLWSFRREFAYALGFTALMNLLMLTPTLYMLQIFDRVMVSQSQFTLFAVTLMLFFFLGVMSFSDWVRSRLLVRLGVQLDMQLNPRVFAAAFEMRNQGEKSAHLFKSLTKLRQFLTGAGLFAILDAPWTPIYMAVLFLLHPLLGVLSIIFCLILWGVAWISKQVMGEPLETADMARENESRHLSSRMGYAAVVESMGMLDNMRGSWTRRHLMALTQGRRGLDAQARMNAISTFVRMLQQSVGLAAGALLAVFGEISPGAMIAASVLMTRATHPMDALMKAWADVVASRKAYLELETALEAFPERETILVEDRRNGVDIQIINVTVGAAERPEPILRGLSLEIPAGMALGVKGASGSGKSTLARVLLGIWPGMQGEVFFDDVPIRALDRATLGANLGYLPQDMELFEGTIAENVARFGKVEPGLVIDACRQAGLHETILRFPNGYDTQIGEGGGFLSGGQRQRVGLARAIYGNPRLVVLDEPNSSLDEAGDRALLQAVLAMKERGTTLVLISHRPQIMAAMDKILVMEAGSALRLEAPPQVSQVPQVGAAASAGVLSGAGRVAADYGGAPRPAAASGAAAGPAQMTQVSVPGATVTAGSAVKPRSRFLAV
ncbi:MAG: type I secretion system permease/ATPase [Azoarcus sp.]|jgi:ATP-binding cassette subfamily C exporter for protease/lipase|nr:type I secretion system permease/ATPase [Azoarcus sp.]